MRLRDENNEEGMERARERKYGPDTITLLDGSGNYGLSRRGMAHCASILVIAGTIGIGTPRCEGQRKLERGDSS